MTLTRDVFSAIFCELWWSLMDYEPPQGKISVYYRALRGYDVKIISKTASDLAMSSDKFPKVDTWRGMCFQASRALNNDKGDDPEQSEKARLMGAIVVPYLSGKITGQDAYEKMAIVYEKFGGDLDENFGDWKGKGYYRSGIKVMPSVEPEECRSVDLDLVDVPQDNIQESGGK